MDVHQNARTTPHSREKIVARAHRGESAREIAAALEICESTVRKWLRRYRAEGLTGLRYEPAIRERGLSVVRLGARPRCVRHPREHARARSGVRALGAVLPSVRHAPIGLGRRADRVPLHRRRRRAQCGPVPQRCESHRPTASAARGRPAGGRPVMERNRRTSSRSPTSMATAGPISSSSPLEAVVESGPWSTDCAPTMGDADSARRESPGDPGWS